MRRIVGLILIIALTIIATLAENFRNSLWVSYRDYNSPYMADLPAGAALTPITPRVVLILVRGLGREPSHQMPTLNDLRGRGADVVVDQTPPTYRLPAWMTLMSGATVETHGVTTNFGPHATNPESIFHAARVAGAPAALIGSQLLGDAFGDDVQRFELIETPEVAQRDDDAIAATLQVLRDPANPMRLVCVELTAIEETVHAGEAIGPALGVTDARIKTLLDALDLTINTVVILSDHGLTSQRQEGGNEVEVTPSPMVMAGAGVIPGGQLMIKAIDVVPTLAALIGTSVPVHTQGQPALSLLLLPSDAASANDATTGATPENATPEEGTPGGQAPDNAETPVEPVSTPVSATVSATMTKSGALGSLPMLLWASATQLTTFYESWSEAVKRPRFAAELLRAYQDGIRAGDTSIYQKFVLELNSAAHSAYRARLDGERAQRLPLVIGVMIFLVALLSVALSSRPLQPLIGTAAYAVTWFALFTMVREYRFSLSMFNNSDPSAFLSGLARDSAVLITGISVFVAVTTSSHEDGLDAVATVLNTVLLIVCVQVAQAAWFYFQWGNNFTWNLPESSALVAVMVALTQAGALSLRIVPELPSLPVPLVLAFLTLIIYSLVKRREQRGQTHYGRLR
jgi:Type I phosphodiesterase / nucleotide pyrophosphatase